MPVGEVVNPSWHSGQHGSLAEALAQETLANRSTVKRLIERTRNLGRYQI